MSENVQKNDAPVMSGQEASVPLSISSNNSIAQGNTANKGRFRKDKTKVLSAESKVNTVAFKFYDEQLLKWGEQFFIDAVRVTKPSVAQVLAIKHDRDTVADGIWQEATVKPHWHVIVRLTKRESRKRVKNILGELGIDFRPGLDDDLWKAHGVETIGNFAGYALYLTHETSEAIREAKELYPIDAIVSNLSVEEIQQIRDGYVRVSEQRKITMDELVALDKESYDIGYTMKDFDMWYDTQPFSVRSHAKMKVLKESYTRGVTARIKEGAEINRVCIFIEGAPNTGKTYAAKKALDGKLILSVGGGGTGKFDRLTAAHDAIVIDDDICPNLLNITDNYICHVYKRNSNNPAWSGDYFIVTSNLTFEEWLSVCGIKTRDRYGMPSNHYKAMVSRFYICCLESVGGVNRLALSAPSDRGSIDDQIDRLNKFTKFRDAFDVVIAGYTPSLNTVDYSSIVDSKC